MPYGFSCIGFLRRGQETSPAGGMLGGGRCWGGRVGHVDVGRGRRANSPASSFTDRRAALSTGHWMSPPPFQS